MSQFGMVIDLNKCMGCGACALGCKAENNTGDRANGQSFNWADFIFRSEGKFPKIRTSTIPVLCNHCSKAPCVEACPVFPKAMFKTENGITMHNDERCIGCQDCQEACPYSVLDLDEEGAEYSVISFNEDAESAYAIYAETEELIEGCTGSGAEIARLTQQVPPHRNLYRHPDYGSKRRGEVTEKCIFCAHRLANGQEPRCVEVCPAEARLFGDLEDPSSKPSRRLKDSQSWRLREEEGTRPNVHYVGQYSAKKNG